MRKNAYGHKKVISIHTKGKHKSKLHTIVSSLTAIKSRKGLKNTQKNYVRPKYVGRKTGRKK